MDTMKEEFLNNTLAVVVTYNRLTMLKQCIQHLQTQTADCDILIVDNASTDGTGEWCRENLSDSRSRKIHYSNTGANLGGAGGFNYGLRQACELGYSYAWIMDDDALAQPDCLEQLLKAADETGSFGFLSSIVLWTDGSLCRMNWQRKLHLPKKRSEHHVTEEDVRAGKRIPIQSATFVSVLFPVSVIRKAGLPIKEFFIWCDDIEYTRRISLKHHYPCYAVPQSQIVHHIANNVGTDLATDSKDRISRYNYAFRNENYMYRQYGLKGFGYYLVVCGYNIFKIIKNAPDHKRKRLGVVIRNLFTGLRFNPPVEKI